MTDGTDARDSVAPALDRSGEIRQELALELLRAAAPPDSQSAVGEQAIEASEDVLRRSPQCLEVRRALGKRLVQVG